MKVFKPPKKHGNEINITSLIDIIFILLIFFMVSSTFLKPTIEIKLPVAATEDKSERKMINVYVGEDLSIYVEKDFVSLENLQSLIAPEIAADNEIAVLLYCDKNVTFENVVKIMDALKLSGVKNVAISHTAGS